jgi:hypothetical protein
LKQNISIGLPTAKKMNKKYFYNTSEPTAYSTLPKVVAVIGNKRRKQISD